MSRIFPIVLILIALGIFLGYVNPTYSGSVTTLRTEIQSYESALIAAETFREKEGELLAQRNEISEEGIARVEAFLPDSVDNVQLILDLNALASRSGIKLSNFDIAVSPASREEIPLGDAASSAVDSLDISVKATGTYAGFRAFLVAAERSLRPLDLIDLSLASSQTGVYEYELTFRMYWLR